MLIFFVHLMQGATCAMLSVVNLTSYCGVSAFFLPQICSKQISTNPSISYNSFKKGGLYD